MRQSLWPMLIPAALLSASVFAPANQGRSGHDYWKTPVPLQEPSPPAAEACGDCHADQYGEWQGSRHALAFSPGLLGQIIDYAGTDAAQCLNCHSPLAEQQQRYFHDDPGNLSDALQAGQPGAGAGHGVICAVCHLRDGFLNVPSVGENRPASSVHQRVRAQPLMRDSRCCSACHQFDDTTSVNGKPLQNTYREWLDSDFPAQGRTCQSCHMPNRAHRFRGIHDPDTVRQGLAIETQTTRAMATLLVSSTDVGHRFPTYMVPRVLLTGTLLDARRQPLPGGTRQRILQRHMFSDQGRWVEHSDTRLKPGEQVALEVPWRSGEQCAAAVRFQIIVDPEWYYHEKVYPAVIDELEAGPARDLLQKAKSLAESHRFVLFDRTLVNSCAG